MTKTATKFRAITFGLAGGAVLWLAGSCTASSVARRETEVAPPPASLSAKQGFKPYLAPMAKGESLLLFADFRRMDSEALARDEAASRRALALREGPRFALATRDADLVSPAATGAFSCAAGLRIGPETTPLLDRLMRRVTVDFGMSTGEAKDEYKRPRPFMVNGQPTCTPQDEVSLRRNGSYPSGHSAAGFGWGLVLAQLLPQRAALLVARGRAFGESRRVCNVHWLSDVEEGRVSATAVFARLQADPVFRADLEAARAELAGAPAPDAAACAQEAAALAIAG